MLEAQTATTDPRFERLVHRLLRRQNNRDSWYQRGREDGENWAFELATRDELHEWADDWEDADSEYEGTDQDDLPKSFALWQSVRKWLLTDLEEAGIVTANLERARISGNLSQALEVALKLAGEETDPAALRKAFEEVDRNAYLNGWYSAVREIWEAVSPALQRPSD